MHFDVLFGCCTLSAIVCLIATFSFDLLHFTASYPQRRQSKAYIASPTVCLASLAALEGCCDHAESESQIRDRRICLPLRSRSWRIAKPSGRIKPHPRRANYSSYARGMLERACRVHADSRAQHLFGPGRTKRPALRSICLGKGGAFWVQLPSCGTAWFICFPFWLYNCTCSIRIDSIRFYVYIYVS